jgi:hypothetical protein
MAVLPEFPQTDLSLVLSFRVLESQSFISSGWMVTESIPEAVSVAPLTRLGGLGSLFATPTIPKLAVAGSNTTSLSLRRAA